MQEALLGSGHTITTEEADADAHVLVTCTVVETTERKMARRMEELAGYEKPFVVAGCMAAAQRDRVQSIVPRAKLLPPRKWPQIVELLGAGTACGDRAAEIESTSFGWRDAIVPIAQGCAGRCTYCITRVARGRVASYAIDAIVGEVRRHVDRGVREIKLTGQDTAAYGLDAGTNLAALLRAVDGIPGDFRVRVGMADPLTVYPIQDDLVDAYASEKVFKFLHLPVQSGDDEILEATHPSSVSDFPRRARTIRRPGGRGARHGAGEAGHHPRADTGIPTSRFAGARDDRRISPGEDRWRAGDGSLRPRVDQWTLYAGANPRWQPRGVVAKHSGLWNPRRQFESARGYSDEGPCAAPAHVRRCGHRRGRGLIRLPGRRRLH